jgi:FtsH-binding integral membrane protein
MYEYNLSRTEQNQVAYDEGLRSFMLSVYNYMTFALAVSGLVSLGISMSPDLLKLIWGTNFKWIAIFSPLVMSLAFAFLVQNMSAYSARVFLIVFAAVMGLSMSSIFLIFKLGSIAQVFFITAATFGATSLYGYTTKRDLTNIGSFLIMGVIGLVIAGLINVFLQSSMMSLVISCISVIVFVGLTAYDTQNLKNTYDELDESEREKAGAIGAFNLYINFINIFMALMNILGEKKE